MHPAKKTGTETLDSSSWTWGLCLIVLTTAIHSLGIVLMSILGLRIRAGLKRRRVAFWQGVAILTGLIAAIGLLLSVLHSIEAALWAAAYLGLGALNRHVDVRYQHGLCFRGYAAVLADATGDPAALTSTAGWRFAGTSPSRRSKTTSFAAALESGFDPKLTSCWFCCVAT